MYPTHFRASSYRFRDTIFFKIYIQKAGQGNGVQFLQLHHSMANVKIYKCLRHIFALALTIWKIKFFLIFYLQKVDKGHRIQFLQLHHSMANVKIYKCRFLHF